MLRFKLLRLVLPSARGLRLSFYCCALFALLSLSSERLLHAELGEASLRFGEQLSTLSELTHDTETVLIDGARFHHARVVLAEPPSRLLDRLERDCDHGPASFAGTLAELAQRGGAQLDRYRVSAPARRGILRYERNGRGTLVCFAAAAATEPRTLAERLRAFAQSRDLTVFGRLRFAYVEPSAGDNVLLTSIWSDDALSLASLFPETGDSAGGDPHVLPRPPGFRRTLSAGAERLPLGVWLYTGSSKPAAVLGFYEPWLTAHGFRRVAAEAALGATAYQRGDGLQAFLSVTPEDDGRTTVGVVEAGATNGNAEAGIESEE